jgi:hypothetical protein
MPANKRVAGLSLALLAGLVFVGWITTQAVSNCATGDCRFVPLVANPYVMPAALPTAMPGNDVPLLLISQSVRAGCVWRRL